MPKIRNIVVLFGDQLNRDSAAFDGFDPTCDRVWMAEVDNESTHVWSHRQRIALFLSAMRHFRDALRAEEITVEYSQLDAPKPPDRLSHRLAIDLRRLSPEKVIAVRPGEWRVLEGLKKVCHAEACSLELPEDRHFNTSPEDFRKHAEGRKSLRMEFFYRELRKRENVLMAGDKPEGGDWNYDKANRKAFGKKGPKDPGSGPDFQPDATTRAVIELVEKRFKKHPGSLASFAWPVTPKQAKAALKRFIDTRLPEFGDHQDAMWTGEAWLYHSLISSSLNLKLLDPREAVAAAESAYRDGRAPLAAVEGFIRQILGWREYVRGIYWTHMPEYVERNAMEAKEPLPEFYWTGDTELTCLQAAIGQTLKHG